MNTDHVGKLGTADGITLVLGLVPIFALWGPAERRFRTLIR